MQANEHLTAAIVKVKAMTVSIVLRVAIHLYQRTTINMMSDGKADLLKNGR
jgi:hypothetical protein